jgi:hypothetical protein
MTSDPFVRRINPDGTQTSSCPKCFKEVATTAKEIILEAAEHLHFCNYSKVSDSVIPGYMTLTERVLMFLEMHSV